VFVFPTLRDLIEDGYKIIGNREDIILDAIRKEENISINAILQSETLLSHTQVSKKLAQCNTTQISRKGTEHNQRRMYEMKYPKIKCHVTLKDTYDVLSIGYFFFGPMHVALSNITHRFQEAGIISMYKDLSAHIIWTLQYSHIIRAEIHAEELSSREVPFVMSDWKMLSIFIIWAFLLGISSIVFLLEHLISEFNSIVSAFISLVWKLVYFASISRIRWKGFAFRLCGPQKLRA